MSSNPTTAEPQDVNRKQRQETRRGPRKGSRRKPGHGNQPMPRKSSSSQVALKWAEGAWEALQWALIRLKCPPLRDALQRGRKQFIDLYTKRGAEGSASKWIKFHSAYAFAAAWCQDELPSSPDGRQVPNDALRRLRAQGNDCRGPREDDGCFCPGPVQTVLKTVMKRARGGSSTYRAIAQDVLMMKVGCPAVTEEFVAQAIEDHRKALSEPQTDALYRAFHEPYPGQFEELYKTKRDIMKKIDEVVSSSFKGTVYSPKDYCPSLHSTFDSKLKEGGALSELVKGFWATRPAELFRPATRELISMTETSPGFVEEAHVWSNPDLVLSFQDYVDGLWLSRLDKPLDVRPVAIKEPLKVRMITKGEAAEYYRCLDFQKLMHASLRKYPIFEWIGSVISEESWDRAFGKLLPLPEGVMMNSGDYKAATDGLDPELSEYTWLQICKSVRVCESVAGSPQVRLLDFSHGAYYRLGLKALTGHRLHYGYGEKETTVDQRWGQLMGSPMSFPILCIVNAAVCLLGMNRACGPDAPLRVNGDDCVFPVTDQQYERWCFYSSAAGLVRSVGKNYRSRYFAIMNSEMHRIIGNRWRLDGWVNQALARGRVRKGVDAGTLAPLNFMEVGPSLSDALRGIRDPVLIDEVVSRALKGYLGQVAKMAPKYMSYWLPLELGGMGIPCSNLSEKMARTEFSMLQRKVATYVTYDADKMSGRPRARSLFPSPLRDAFGKVGADCPSSWRSRRVDEAPLDWVQPTSRLTGEFYLTELLLQCRDAPWLGLWSSMSTAGAPFVGEFECNRLQRKAQQLFRRPFVFVDGAWKAPEYNLDELRTPPQELRKAWYKWVKPAIENYYSTVADPNQGIRPWDLSDTYVGFCWSELVQLPEGISSRANSAFLSRALLAVAGIS